MLTLPKYVAKGTFERILRARNGALMRVRFEVYEVEGSLKGKVLGIEPVLSIKGQLDSTLSLADFRASNQNSSEYVSPFKSVISPYIELYFFTSQPTRAPAFK